MNRAKEIIDAGTVLTREAPAAARINAMAPNPLQRVFERVRALNGTFRGYEEPTAAEVNEQRPQQPAPRKVFKAPRRLAKHNGPQDDDEDFDFNGTSNGSEEGILERARAIKDMRRQSEDAKKARNSLRKLVSDPIVRPKLEEADPELLEKLTWPYLNRLSDQKVLDLKAEIFVALRTDLDVQPYEWALHTAAKGVEALSLIGFNYLGTPSVKGLSDDLAKDDYSNLQLRLMAYEYMNFIEITPAAALFGSVLTKISERVKINQTEAEFITHVSVVPEEFIDQYKDL